MDFPWFPSWTHFITHLFYQVERGVNSPKLYTAGTNIGLSKGRNANLQKQGNNKFANAVTDVTAARENSLVALVKPLYSMCCKTLD